MADEELAPESGERTGLGTVIGAAVLAIALVAFIFQNTDDTPVEWLFVSESAPLWLIIVISAVAGAALSEVLGWLIRRRRRRS